MHTKPSKLINLRLTGCEPKDSGAFRKARWDSSFSFPFPPALRPPLNLTGRPAGVANHDNEEAVESA
jgi:hypothetical protein